MGKVLGLRILRDSIDFSQENLAEVKVLKKEKILWDSLLPVMTLLVDISAHLSPRKCLSTIKCREFIVYGPFLWPQPDSFDHGQ